MPESRIDDLNPEQLRAATAGEGPVLTIAGAGTGKTKTLAARMAWLVSQGIDPGRDHASCVHAQGFGRDVAPGPESLG
jgi:superfamily I DNA/RNA helicase